MSSLSSLYSQAEIFFLTMLSFEHYDRRKVNCQWHLKLQPCHTWNVSRYSHSCNILLRLQCSFVENKPVSVMHDEPEQGKLEIPLNWERIALQSQESVTSVTIWLLGEAILSGQFFTCDCNAIFRNYCVAVARKKLQPGYMVCQQNLPIEHLLKYSEFLISLQC